jgi:hypothetical protein
LWPQARTALWPVWNSPRFFAPERPSPSGFLDQTAAPHNVRDDPFRAVSTNSQNSSFAIAFWNGAGGSDIENPSEFLLICLSKSRFGASSGGRGALEIGFAEEKNSFRRTIPLRRVCFYLFRPFVRTRPYSRENKNRLSLVARWSDGCRPPGRRFGACRGDAAFHDQPLTSWTARAACCPGGGDILDGNGLPFHFPDGLMRCLSWRIRDEPVRLKNWSTICKMER